jgi:hypothetical protein
MITFVVTLNLYKNAFLTIELDQNVLLFFKNAAAILST